MALCSDCFILESSSASTDGWMSLFTGIQVQVMACAFQPTQQRISDHLFSPSGDHKILTRIYVMRSIVPRYSLVGRLFFCPPSLLISSSNCTPFLHQPSSRRASLLSFSEHVSGQLWCGNRIYRAEEQSSMITLRHVGTC